MNNIRYIWWLRRAFALVLVVTTGACGNDFETVPDKNSAEINAQSPRELTVSTADPYGITLSWKDRSSIETGFWINRKSDPDQPFERLGIAVADSTLYQDPTVLTDTTYTYMIESVQGQVVLGASNEVTTWIPTYRMKEIRRYPLPTSPVVLGIDRAGVAVQLPGSGLWGYRYKPKYLTFEKQWAWDDLAGTDILQILFKGTRLWIVYLDNLASSTKIVRSKKWPDAGNKKEKWLHVRFLYRSSPSVFSWKVAQTVALLPESDFEPKYVVADSYLTYLYFTLDLLPNGGNSEFCRLDMRKTSSTKVFCTAVNSKTKAHTLHLAKPENNFFFVSGENANYAVEHTLPAFDWEVISTVPNAPLFERFNYMNGVTWARDSEGQFYRFTSVQDFVSGTGELVDFGVSLRPDRYQEVFQLAPSRTVLLGCKMGVQIYNRSFHRISSFGLSDCPTAAGLIGSYIIYADDNNNLVRKLLSPRIER